MGHTGHHGRQGGRWGSGCERDHLGAHREARRCGRGHTGARLHGLDQEQDKSMKALTGVTAVIVVVISHDGLERRKG